MLNGQIRNIIFDLGGVILNIDYLKLSAAFKTLGIENFDELYSQVHASALFKQIECGEISPQEFINELKQHSVAEISDEELINAWNAILGNFPRERISILKKLKTRYRTFLLSNTNAIHHAKFLQIFSETFAEGSLDDCFEKAYYSHEIGLRKPNKEAYEFVLNTNSLKPEETMFIDDTFINVEAANALGIRGLYLQPPQAIEDVFKTENLN